MRKYLIIIFALFLSVGLVSCGELSQTLNNKGNLTNNPDNGSNPIIPGDNSTGNNPENPTQPTDPENPPVNPPPVTDPENPPTDPIDPPVEPPVEPETPPVDPYQCAPADVINTGKKATKSVKVYPLVTVIGNQSSKCSYQTADCRGRYPYDLTNAAKKLTIQVGGAETIVEFGDSNFVTGNGSQESLRANNLKAQNMVITYPPTSGFKLPLPVTATADGTNTVFRFNLNASEDNSYINIPAHPNLDTSKEYYAKITYNVFATERTENCYKGPCFNYTKNIKFECLVEKK